MRSNQEDRKNPETTITRRQFMGRTVAAAAGVMIVPNKVLGGKKRKAPSDTLNIGCVGVGGKGSSDIVSVSGENIVALCDVDDLQMAEFFKYAEKQNQPELMTKLAKAHRYRDFREMLSREKSIDAITVTTPDQARLLSTGLPLIDVPASASIFMSILSATWPPRSTRGVALRVRPRSWYCTWGKLGTLEP